MHTSCFREYFFNASPHYFLNVTKRLKKKVAKIYDMQDNSELYQKDKRDDSTRQNEQIFL